MAQQTITDLFDRWEQVWHEDRHELIGDCVGPVYIRHEEAGTRHVTPVEYAEEILATKRDRPNIRFTVYDHGISDDRAWFRFSMNWNDAGSGERRSRAGFQVYRVEAGRLAETWVMFFGLGSTWPDAAGQERWMSARAA